MMRCTRRLVTCSATHVSPDALGPPSALDHLVEAIHERSELQQVIGPVSRSRRRREVRGRVGLGKGARYLRHQSAVGHAVKMLEPAVSGLAENAPAGATQAHRGKVAT